MDEFGAADGHDYQPRRPLGAAKITIAGCLIGSSAAALLFAASNVFAPTHDSALNQDESCHLTKVWSEDASARVLAFLSERSAIASQVVTERDLGGPMSPRYESFRTVKVVVLPSGHIRGVRIPPELTVKVGDMIDFAAGRRDPSAACAYIPNLIKRVRG